MSEHRSAAGSRIRINSFDVFDTLIARRCIEAHGVFSQLQIQTEITDFAERRRSAEAAVSAGPYTLADIYVRLTADLDLPQADAERLAALEVEAELAAVMPIAENLAKLRDGDLLISDMYLGEAVIRRLLAKAGLDKQVGLIVSAHGKRSGEVWPKVSADFDIGLHLGDNDHADVAMPAAFGVASAKTDLFAPSHVEAWLINLGLRDLAQLLREARLTTWCDDPVRRRLQLLQMQINLPLLILSSLRLMGLARELGASHFLFSSRDCKMWLPLYRAVAAQTGQLQAPAEYFYTSRRARVDPSADYQTYARERLGARGMVVDTCGSGWSMAALQETIGLAGRDMFFIHQIKTPAAYLARRPVTMGPVHSLVGPDTPGVNNMMLEMCNTAEHPSIRDVRYVAGAPLPVFEEDPRPEPLRRRIVEQNADFTDAAALLERAPLDRTLSLSSSDIALLVDSLYRYLCQDAALVEIFAQAHLDEDRAAMRAMGIAGFA